jgi:cytochrome c
MQDNLRWNKIFGAILATSLVMLFLREGSQMLFATGGPPAKPGYAVAVQAEAPAGGEAEAADTPPDWGTVLPAADVAAGQAVSAKCQSCHNFAQGGPNVIGPNLWGVVGRKPASHEGFAYSAGMQAEAAKFPVWDYEHVYEFLKNPGAYVQGTKMGFAGLKKPEDRINLIAWLRQQSSSPLPIPAPNPAAAAPAAAAPADAAAAPAAGGDASAASAPAADAKASAAAK